MRKILSSLSGQKIRTAGACMAALILLAGILPDFPVRAWSSDDLGWSAWERKHSVARKESWMVIKEPGRDACYLKQSYIQDQMMDLTVDESGSPCLWGPFSPSPVDVEVRFEIDDLKQGRMTARDVTNGIRLPRNLVQTMRRGFSLQVEIKSLDPDTELGTVSEQEFSLLGFTGATEELESDACRK